MIERISLEGKQIILVGTAHVSRQSVELVKKTIEEEKPDVVGIELDAERYNQLKSGRKWQETNVSELIKKGQLYVFLLNLLLANLQRKIGQQLGVKPGEEMFAACAIAEKKKIPIALLDRSVRITLKRAIQKTSLREKFRLLLSFIAGLFGEGQKIDAEKVEQMKQKDMMTELMNELSRQAPSVKEVLVDERDKYIAYRINSLGAKKIVAVLGAGHLEGVKKFLGKPVDILELESIQKKKSYWGLLKYLVPALFVLVLAWGFYARGFVGGLQLFAYWFLITGIFSAIGAIFAKSHAVSILTAFVAAPFTTLHPALASGWFAAAAEAKFRNPKVKDFESLSSLNSYKDFEKNNVTHLLLVAAYTNIGSTIGVIAALPYLVKLLGIG